MMTAMRTQAGEVRQLRFTAITAAILRLDDLIDVRLKETGVYHVVEIAKGLFSPFKIFYFFIFKFIK